MKTLQCYDCSCFYEAVRSHRCRDGQIRCKLCVTSEKRRNPEQRKVSQKASRTRNIEKIRARDRARYAKNPEKNKNRVSLKLKSDPIYKLSHTIRTRINRAIAIEQKVGSAVRDLGCSIPELKQYLENQFQPGMTWKNQGKWHIDHIKPLSKFDLTDREQFIYACHYTNLQPLWAFDNLSKGAR